MTDQPDDFATDNLTGLEAALRDAAARSVKPEMPLALALQFYRSVIGLARCLRMVRKDAGLPRGLSQELILLLGAVRVSASKRLTAPGLSDDMTLRLLKAIEGLVRSVLLAIPAPEKPKKNSNIKALHPETPRPDAEPKAAARPVPPAPPRHRRDELVNVGAISIQALNAGIGRNATIANAVQLARLAA